MSEITPLMLVGLGLLLAAALMSFLPGVPQRAKLVTIGIFLGLGAAITATAAELSMGVTVSLPWLTANGAIGLIVIVLVYILGGRKLTVKNGSGRADAVAKTTSEATPATGRRMGVEQDRSDMRNLIRVRTDEKYETIDKWLHDEHFGLFLAAKQSLEYEEHPGLRDDETRLRLSALKDKIDAQLELEETLHREFGLTINNDEDRELRDQLESVVNRDLQEFFSGVFERTEPRIREEVKQDNQEKGKYLSQLLREIDRRVTELVIKFKARPVV